LPCMNLQFYYHACSRNKCHLYTLNNRLGGPDRRSRRLGDDNSDNVRIM
jgi:hypothetical protein